MIFSLQIADSEQSEQRSDCKRDVLQVNVRKLQEYLGRTLTLGSSFDWPARVGRVFRLNPTQLESNSIHFHSFSLFSRGRHSSLPLRASSVCLESIRAEQQRRLRPRPLPRQECNSSEAKMCNFCAVRPKDDNNEIEFT